MYGFDDWDKAKEYAASTGGILYNQLYGDDNYLVYVRGNELTNCTGIYFVAHATQLFFGTCGIAGYKTGWLARNSMGELKEEMSFDEIDEFYGEEFDDLDEAKKYVESSGGILYTQVDGDDGERCYVRGNAFVNRTGMYFVVAPGY